MPSRTLHMAVVAPIVEEFSLFPPFFFFRIQTKTHVFSRYTRHRHQIPIEALCSVYLSVSLGLYILNGICRPIPIVSRFAYLFIP